MGRQIGSREPLPVTEDGDGRRLVEISLRLVWAGANMRLLDFLRWLVQHGRNPEWDGASEDARATPHELG